VRLRLPLLGLGAALMLGGCTQASANSPTIELPAGAPSIPKVSAADAGGACLLLDFDVIEEVVGARFDVAAATSQGKTSTCVVQSSEASLPDLMVSVSPTTADAAVFRSEMQPDEARTVKALGKAGYRVTAKAAKGRGPTAEVCWLSGDKQLITMRYTLPVGAARSAADQVAGKLVTLAKKTDAARA
jgi:hypothetical protein